MTRCVNANLIVLAIAGILSGDRTIGMFFRHQASAERIVAVAVQMDKLILTLLPPARHADLLADVHKATGVLVTADQQGFLTSEGRFRHETGCPRHCCCCETGRARLR